MPWPAPKTRSRVQKEGIFLRRDKASRKDSFWVSADSLGGVGGLDLKRRKEGMQMERAIMASISIRSPMSDLPEPSPTIIEGSANPIATPKGFVEAPIVVASAL